MSSLIIAFRADILPKERRKMYSQTCVADIGSEQWNRQYFSYLKEASITCFPSHDRGAFKFVLYWLLDAQQFYGEFDGSKKIPFEEFTNALYRLETVDFRRMIEFRDTHMNAMAVQLAQQMGSVIPIIAPYEPPNSYEVTKEREFVCQCVDHMIAVDAHELLVHFR